MRCERDEMRCDIRHKKEMRKMKIIHNLISPSLSFFVDSNIFWEEVIYCDRLSDLESKTQFPIFQLPEFILTFDRLSL